MPPSIAPFGTSPSLAPFAFPTDAATARRSPRQRWAAPLRDITADDPSPALDGFQDAQASFDFFTPPRLPAPAPLLPPPQPGQAPPRRLPLPADPLADPPDPAILARYGAAQALRDGLLPWRDRDGEVVILTATPSGYDRKRRLLGTLYAGRVRPLPCPRPLIESALLAHAGPALAQASESRPAAIDSCRSLDRVALNLGAALLLAGLIALAFLDPGLFIGLLLGLSLLSFATLLPLKVIASLAALRRPPPAPPVPPREDLPTLSLLIALYGEAEIAPRLIRRLSALDYPRDRLDVLLLVETGDTATRRALAAADLPPWMRIIAVPKGRVQTKPRALNFGLDFARGSILGIYDAEDAPEPDQLLKVAAAFAAGPPDLACLQGALDFYNPRTNWLSRAFTLDYAAWFRLFLPGLARLGLPMPLGGTTVFLQREALIRVGAWDAHNVTEDADLGLRLARKGYRTDFLPSTTHEEANCHALAWVRQRSRWIKGYLMTWLVHMRDPLALWRDLGPLRFAVLQILLLSSIFQGIANPMLWSLLVLSLGLPHPATDLLSSQALLGLAVAMALAQVIDAGLTALALRRTGHRRSWLWLPLMKPYAFLTSAALAKALAGAAFRPFHWDKTGHGQYDKEA